MLKNILPLIAIIAFILWADEPRPKIVVMNLFGENVGERDLLDLTNKLEKELIATDKFTITARSRINNALDEYGVQQKEAKSVPWIVRIGKKLNVDKVVAGSVNNAGSLITVHIRTIDVQKQRIDKSATEVCRNCSIDVIYLRKMASIARKLAGMAVDTSAHDSLFTFSPGPLIKLDQKPDDTSVSANMSKKIFAEWSETKVRSLCRIGGFLYSLGAALLILDDIIWTTAEVPPETNRRMAIVLSEMALSFGAIPFFLKAQKTGIGMHSIAADTTQSKVEKGFKLGLNIACFNPYNYIYPDDFAAHSGLVGGFHLDINYNSFFAIRSGLLFSQKGSKEDIENPDEKRHNLSYLEIPLTCKSAMPFKGGFSINVLCGLSPSLLISAKEKHINKDTKIGLDDVKRFDLGFLYSLELAWNLPNGALNFEFLNTEGLIDLGNHWNLAEPLPKNRIFSFIMGYKF